jgi:hypothetical protein
MQQVKARYIYILGVKRLDFIIKSWIIRKLLSFSQSGRLDSRIDQILHTRIRTESSALKDHLYKKNIEANPYCSCKLVVTSEHFLLKMFSVGIGWNITFDIRWKFVPESNGWS